MKKSAKSLDEHDIQASAYGLSLKQQNAVDLLAAGKNDTDTAAALKLNRVTVTRWRLYSAAFRAALADQRAAVWGSAADRLRTLLPKALDTLAEALDKADDRVTVALAVLKLAGPLPLPPTESTDPEDFVQHTVDHERERIRNSRHDALDAYYGLPKYKDHLNNTRTQLEMMVEPRGLKPDLSDAGEVQ